MRSAIKAKLTELDCYVDDELPDYIMVMVANKRTKSEMNKDLKLFLTNKTSTFVDWLHIVLKKLEEVTVTNPEVYKKVVKTKTESDSHLDFNIKVKKEKKHKSKQKKAKKENEEQVDFANSLQEKSLTDDLPISANALTEKRKIVIMQDNQVTESINKDKFDVPPCSEVIMESNETEDVEKVSVKTRLGLVIDSDSDDADFLNLKPEPVNLLKRSNQNSETVNVSNEADENKSTNKAKTTEHSRIVFQNESINKKKSILERLGKRTSDKLENSSVTPNKKTRISLLDVSEERQIIFGRRKGEDNLEKRNENRRDQMNDENISCIQEKPRQSILSRLGVMSKISIPKKDPPQNVIQEEEPVKKEVPSMIKVKPRVLPPRSTQANKTLLLKAVAEAQRSIAQTPTVGTNKVEALFTKSYKEKKINMAKGSKCSKIEKSPVLKRTSDEFEDDFFRPPQKRFIYDSSNQNGKCTRLEKQTFVITLDGIEEETKFKNRNDKNESTVPERTEKRAPSPIIFNKDETAECNTKPEVPTKLPKIQTPPTIKNKERCRFWPACKQGEKCEFVHPMMPCKLFPQCKFGDKCLFIHPSCKFASSCTKRDCPYSHGAGIKGKGQIIVTSSVAASQTYQTCKYFPNCTNVHCTFYHPRPCKYGQFCKNQSQCSFSHVFIPSKASLSWRSNFKS